MSSIAPPTKLRVLIVRHGETRENVERIIQGQLDTDLNERGRQQAEITGRFLANVHIDRVIASPLKRSADTARAICNHQNESRQQHQGRLELEFDDRLKERGFGVLEGKVYQGGSKKPEDTEGIERMEPFSERLGSFWNDLVTRTVASQTQNAKEERTETVVLVSHGAAISADESSADTGTVLYRAAYSGSFSLLELLHHRTSRPRHLDLGCLDIIGLTWTSLPQSKVVHQTNPSRRSRVAIPARPPASEAALATAKSASTPTEAIDQLEAMVKKTEAEFERDPAGKKQLEEDTIKAPDGTTVNNDIGYGKAIGVVVQWSNVDHLKELEAKPSPTVNSSSSTTNNVNVDELVK